MFPNCEGRTCLPQATPYTLQNPDSEMEQLCCGRMREGTRVWWPVSHTGLQSRPHLLPFLPQRGCHHQPLLPTLAEMVWAGPGAWVLRMRAGLAPTFACGRQPGLRSPCLWRNGDRGGWDELLAVARPTVRAGPGSGVPLTTQMSPWPEMVLGAWGRADQTPRPEVEEGVIQQSPDGKEVVGWRVACL